MIPVSAAPPWGYARHDGPALWGTLDPAFRACALGREQSPIDLSAAGHGRVGHRRRGLQTLVLSSRSWVHNGAVDWLG